MKSLRDIVTVDVEPEHLGAAASSRRAWSRATVFGWGLRVAKSALALLVVGFVIVSLTRRFATQTARAVTGAVADVVLEPGSSLRSGEDITAALEELERELATVSHAASAPRAAAGSPAQHVQELRIRIAQYQGTLRTLETRLDALGTAPLGLSAPAGGRVGGKARESGAPVTQQTPALALVRCEDLRVVAAAPSGLFRRLHPGGQARFRLDGSSELHAGRIERLLPAPQIRTSAVNRWIAPGLDPEQAWVVLTFPTLARSLAPQCTVGHAGTLELSD